MGALLASCQYFETEALRESRNALTQASQEVSAARPQHQAKRARRVLPARPPVDPSQLRRSGRSEVCPFRIASALRLVCMNAFLQGLAGMQAAHPKVFT